MTELPPWKTHPSSSESSKICFIDLVKDWGASVPRALSLPYMHSISYHSNKAVLAGQIIHKTNHVAAWGLLTLNSNVLEEEHNAIISS